ncbi:hypothetical protein LTR70_008899 [Exophiala xenobiotica]|uniref:Alcohol dehydrogenase-like C-terminal domain-containing protein n=1 Tax=Lithohypha guttulata TaxID=1690604 RepID=A0ABR0JZ08_9EURO|nr:hypothetical protein LTR24_008892 [Lithohypha guttulata]KAK5311260.1 hypothetical protein LTR70_008899 [Exophiala xenobiotica]
MPVFEGISRLLEHYPVGGLSQYLLSPDTNIAVLPKSIDTAMAPRFGYLGTSFVGLKRANVGPGNTLLINGVTAILGYGAVAIGLGLGCTKILGIGRNRERLTEVRSLSLQGRVVVRSSEDEGDIVEWVKQQINGLGPDALYDCLGVGGDASSTSNLVGCVKQGGRLILAAGGAERNIGGQPYFEVMMHNVAVLGTIWFNSAELDEMIILIDAGVIDFSFLRHKFFALVEVNKAFRTVGDRPGGAVNVVSNHMSEGCVTDAKAR